MSVQAMLGRPGPVLSVLVAGGLALWGVGMASAGPAAARSSRHHPSRPVLTKTVHAALGTCPAKDVTVKVSLTRLTFTAKQIVDVRATVTDVGAVACSFSGSGPATTLSSTTPSSLAPQYIGPCGALGMQVNNSKGVNVWPGRVAYGCPMMISKVLRPGQHFTATGEWTQQQNSPLSGTAPRGVYVLKVAEHASFTLTLK
jgi:hypothetical protein